mmetsp:Transcript_29972/g.33649  ORF Transcript_29972/g.33649 Transcript_29972/m.33649 type:complete len:676 (+) Transcript_29972:257-2284(+)
MMIQSTATVPVTTGGVNIADKIDVPPVHVPPSGTIDEKKESPSATDEVDHNTEYNIASSAAQFEQDNHQQRQQQQQQYNDTTPQYHNPYAIQYAAAPHIIAGMVPPQQVYVQQQQAQAQQLQQAQLPLETQFQSLGLGNNSNDHVAGDNNEGRNNNTTSYEKNDTITSNNDLLGAVVASTDNEENIINSEIEGGADDEIESEEEPIKLFVGQVPKTMNEEDIFPTFDSFGPLKDVSIIRDKQTQLHRGCAFVTYWTSNDADKAQEALHGKHVFPGARRPAQVKPAEPSVPENKLFVGMLSRKAGEDEICELFAPFGEIREIYMIRNADGSSKCAAFLRYVDRDSAIQAIEMLHNNLVMEGSARPLIVKFADNKHQRAQRHIRNVRRQELMTVMGPGAGYPGAYPAHHMAMAPPLGGPSHQYPPHHMGGPLPHLPQYGAPYPGGPGSGGPPPIYNPMYPPHHYGGPPHAYGAGFQNNRQGSLGSAGGGNRHPNNNTNPSNPNQAANPRPREGPAGANLFVYHLPHDLTDADLATAFNPFGNVISAKVYVDRYTGESKGFGFVSYDSVISAESAIEQMNGFQIGNKRLKVQHKRVHNNGSGNRGGGGGQEPQMNPHEHHHQQPSQQQQQHLIPFDSAPPDISLDVVSNTPDSVLTGVVPIPTSQIGDITAPTPVMIS